MAMINTGGEADCPKGWWNMTIVDEREWVQCEKKTGGRIKDEDLDKYSDEEKVMRKKIQFIYETDEVDENGNPYRVEGKKLNLEAKGNKSGLALFLKDVAPEFIGKPFDSKKEIIGRRFRVRVDHEPKQNGDGVWVNIGVHTDIEERQGQTASDIPAHR
jgi:hypothetical protein